MIMKTVLFVCIHNSARSQMAEAFVNHSYPQSIAASSAGLEPGKLNPLVVEVMREIGIDISHHKTKSVFDMLASGQKFDYVITVCDEANAERCPVFPGVAQRLHWGFPDPSALAGTDEERLTRTREIRDLIREQVQDWCDQQGRVRE
jgi:arsenate reductase